MNLFSLARFPFQCVGAAIDLALTMRAVNKHSQMLAGAWESRLVAAEAESEDTPYCNRCGRPHPVNGVCGRDAVCGTCGLKLVDYEHTLCAVDFLDPALDADRADVSPAISPAGDTGPEGLSHSPRDPSGPPNDALVELIAEVLAEEAPFADVRYGPMGSQRFNRAGDWRAHVAPLIAARIEKATPPMGLRLDGGDYA